MASLRRMAAHVCPVLSWLHSPLIAEYILAAPAGMCGGLWRWPLQDLCPRLLNVCSAHAVLQGRVAGCGIGCQLCSV